ncbi:hypothetical protein [uncultured Bacteroides sp.]|uniref:hypothetical protein n=1 Tax=uncultured Bacteroides sp. TaxID=162156 RepID=UPI002AAABDE2|nr:hypothetical protein [uncultured Bacteroides sp.]
MKKINIWKALTITLLALIVSLSGIYLYRNDLFRHDYQLTDDLGGNIFPSAILSIATTDAVVVKPAENHYLGNPKSGFIIRIKSARANSKVRITLSKTPFFEESVSEFVLEESNTVYQIFPDVIWNYEALKNNNQAAPVSVSVEVEMNGASLGKKVRTYSVRSVNECLLAYLDSKQRFHDTGIFFAAYVNEEHPMIDKLLREALNTRLVNRFVGYQSSNPGSVEKQVYALWNVLQKRNFKYSSVSTSSLSSNVVFSQRVRTLDDALESSQVNCVDGSVLFASLLRAINIDPILVRIPGHMFVGYYLDKAHKRKEFMETTMIGDVNLDEFFPDERLDSTMVGKSQNEMSRFTFEKSKEYATKLFKKNLRGIKTHQRFYMYLEISKEVRRNIQPIGK